MDEYRISLAPAAVRDLKRIKDATQLRRIAAAIDQLMVDPRPFGVKKLAGDDELWRVRVGRHRIIYQIEDDQLLILVVRIRDRKDAYRK